MSNNKPTLIIGATHNPSRYAYKAIDSLQSHGFGPLVPMGIKRGEVLGLKILPPLSPIDQEIHTVTMYINPKLQREYYSFLLELNPQRVIFNPGTENPEFAERLKAQSIECLSACTLVMLSIKQY